MSCDPCRYGRHPDCTNRGCLCNRCDHTNPHPSVRRPPEWGIVNLPICSHTDLPRILCDHCDSFRMTEDEITYLAGQVEPPKSAPRRHHRIQHVDYPRRRYDPKDAPLLPDWRINPKVIVCDHGHDDTRFICDDCEQQLQALVADTPALVHELQLAFTKQTQFLDQGAPIEADPDEAPLNWHEAASRVLRDLRRVYNGDPTTVAQHMLRTWPNILRRPDLPQLATQISETLVHAHQIIDRPPTLLDYGPCPNCETRIRQERISEGDTDREIICPKGDYVASLHDHQVTQINREETKPKTAGQIQEALRIIGTPLSKHAWDNMVARDGLPREKQNIAHWRNGRLESAEVWVYRLKDVRDMIRVKNRRDDVAS